MLRPNPAYTDRIKREDRQNMDEYEALKALGGELDDHSPQEMSDAQWQMFMQNIHQPASMYVDTDGTHEAAAKQLITLAKKRGVRSIADELKDIIAPNMNRSIVEQINPDLALPATYLLAKRLHDIEMAHETESDALATTKDSSSFRQLNHRLEQLINRSNLYDTSSPTDEKFDDDGAIKLSYALTEATMRLEEAGQLPYQANNDELAVTCEALGQLCVEELQRRMAEPTHAPKGKHTIQELERRPIALPGSTKGGRGET